MLYRRKEGRDCRNRMTQQTHTQVRLRRYESFDKFCYTETVTYVPTKFAVIGETLSLKVPPKSRLAPGGKQEWVDGYEVIKVYKTSTDDSKEVWERSQYWKTHRDATDVRRSERRKSG